MKGKLCRGRLTEISFYENDTSGSYSPIYENILLKQLTALLPEEVVSDQISLELLLRIVYFGLFLKLMQGALFPFQLCGRCADKAFPETNVNESWIKPETCF